MFTSNYYLTNSKEVGLVFVKQEAIILYLSSF